MPIYDILQFDRVAHFNAEKLRPHLGMSVQYWQNINRSRLYVAAFIKPTSAIK